MDPRQNFKEHQEIIFKKVSKTIELFSRPQDLSLKKSLITLYKSFIRPHASFHRILELIQYNAALAITGALRGTSKEKLYQALGFESLKQRRWYRKLCHFYKIFNLQSPNYLYKSSKYVFFTKLAISLLLYVSTPVAFFNSAFLAYLDKFNPTFTLLSKDFGSEKYSLIYTMSFLSIKLSKELLWPFQLTYSLSHFLLISFSILNNF